MKKLRPLFISFVFLLMLFFGIQIPAAFAQLPNCSYFYWHSGTTIYQYNTATNTSSVNSIALPGGAGGLAVSNNLNAASPAVTFYTTVGGIYYYYNGASWVSTGHSTGNASAVNIGGAGPYIYNLNGLGQQVYRYDGTGAGVLVLSLPGWGGPFDCIGDASGNFYILNTFSAPYNLTMYDPNGNVICVYNLVGFPTSSAGGGYAIVGNVLYASIGGTNCYGNIVGNTITYAGPLTLSPGPSDMANCEFPPLLVNIATPGTLTCATPTTILNATSSLSGTSWSWTGPGVVSGGNTSSPTVNMPGTYTVTVTGSGGCTTSATATCVVTQSGGINLSATITNVLCNGASTGAIDLTPSAGATPYTYSWTGGGAMEDPSGLAAGTYTVLVTDNSGCTNTASYTITEPPTAISLVTSSNPALCGAATGSASVVASGGAGGYTYSWSPSGGAAANAASIVAGTYTVTVTDANLCTQSATVTVGSTSAVVVTVNSLADVTCLGGNDGSVSVTGSGGVAPYSYVWSSGSLTNTASNLTAGTYTVVVSDGGGCSTSATYTINPGSNPPAIDLQGDVLTGCVVHCVNFDIPAIISTGNLQTYQWMVGGAAAGNNPTLQYCFNTPGVFDIALTVTDTLGCTNTINKPAYIQVQDFPMAEFTTDKTTYLQSDPTVHIVDQSANAASLFWLLGDGTTQGNLADFYHAYMDTGTYCITLIASSPLGCADSVMHCINILGESYYYIPNSFTPNDDGLNDVFYPVASSIMGYTIEIFDRWGEKIFTSAKDDDVWNGHVKGTNIMAPQGVYVYKILIKDAQGIGHEFMGHVNLIR
jgi:gliding motility-associated-like protein